MNSAGLFGVWDDDDLIESRQLSAGSETSLRLHVTVVPSADVPAALDSDEFTEEDIARHEDGEWGLVDIWVSAHYGNLTCEVGAAVLREQPYGKFPGQQEELDLNWYLRHAGTEIDYLQMLAKADAYALIAKMNKIVVANTEF
jgi:hypothetical protein